MFPFAFPFHKNELYISNISIDLNSVEDRIYMGNRQITPLCLRKYVKSFPHRSCQISDPRESTNKKCTSVCFFVSRTFFYTLIFLESIVSYQLATYQYWPLWLKFDWCTIIKMTTGYEI